MKYLGIDYGTKRVGVANSDEDGRMAFPNCVLPNDSNLIEALKKIITEEKIEKVVIGESKNFKMQDNEIMTEILDLKKIIETEFSIDADLHSEVLTSVEAEKIAQNFNEKISRRSKSKNMIKETLDANAAAIILQSYLDLNK